MFAIMLSGLLILVDNIYGSLLGILGMTYYAILHMNPWIVNDESRQ